MTAVRHTVANGFGRRLREVLGARQVTQSELARRVGVSNNTVTNWVHGVHRPDLTHLERVADALSVDPNDLLRDANPVPGRSDEHRRIVAALAALDVDSSVAALAREAPDLIRILADARRLAKPEAPSDPARG